PARDFSGNNNNAANAALPVDGSLIGTGVQFDGKRAVEIPASESLRSEDGSAWTYSMWIKPSLANSNGVLYTRTDGSNAVQIRLQNGAPVARISANGATSQTEAAAALPENTWSHLAVSASGDEVRVFVNGEP